MNAGDAIIKQLSDQPMTAMELGDVTGYSRITVSEWLNRLRRAGEVELHCKGRVPGHSKKVSYYRLSGSQISSDRKRVRRAIERCMNGTGAWSEGEVATRLVWAGRDAVKAEFQELVAEGRIRKVGERDGRAGRPCLLFAWIGAIDRFLMRPAA